MRRRRLTWCGNRIERTRSLRALVKTRAFGMTPFEGPEKPWSAPLSCLTRARCCGIMEGNLARSSRGNTVIKVVPTGDFVTRFTSFTVQFRYWFSPVAAAALAEESRKM